jgi:hypothetical protein
MAQQNRQQVAPSHSITWSARARSDGGTVRPSAFAVFRLMTSSNLVGCCTGRSAGFSPSAFCRRMGPRRRHHRWERLAHAKSMQAESSRSKRFRPPSHQRAPPALEEPILLKSSRRCRAPRRHRSGHRGARRVSRQHARVWRETARQCRSPSLPTGGASSCSRRSRWPRSVLPGRQQAGCHSRRGNSWSVRHFAPSLAIRAA